MKKILFLIFPLFIFKSNGQSISFLPSNTNSSNLNFTRMIGYDVSYRQKLFKKNYMGISISQRFRNNFYNYVYTSQATNKAYFLTTNPNNRMNSIAFQFEHKFSKDSTSAFFIGLSGSINNFKRNELIQSVELKKNQFSFFKFIEKKNLLPGIGLNFNAQQKIGNRLWIFLQYSPSMVFYSKNSLDKINDPKLILFHTLGIGLNYRK